MVGERIEIMVNLGNDAVGSSLDLKAFNSGQVFGFPGAEPQQSGLNGSLLNNKDFAVLHINIAATTAAPITSVPAVLAHDVYWTAADATVSRTVNVTNGTRIGLAEFTFDNAAFALNTINKTVNLNAIEKWTVVNNNIFSHAFHIHDVEFKIVARNGVATAVGSHESGWKDTYYLPKGENVTFVAKFDDYADPIHPFMYHCHFSNHEDGGMMGQFVVTATTATNEVKAEINYALYPNPTSEKLFIRLADATTEVYYITVTNVNGKAVMMLPQPEIDKGIDISALANGVYFIQLMDKKTKSVTSQKFIKL